MDLRGGAAKARALGLGLLVCGLRFRVKGLSGWFNVGALIISCSILGPKTLF